MRSLSLTDWYYVLGISAIVGAGLLFVWRKVVRPTYRYTRERMRRVSGALDSVEIIMKQMFPNGGTSMRDVVNRTADMMTDLTKAVSMSVAQNRSLFDQSTVCMFEGDDEGDVVWGNRALRHLTGMQGEQLTGSGWINAVHDDDRRRVQNDWVLATGTRRAFLSVFRVTHIGTGESTAVQCEAVPVFADGGICSGWLALIRLREADA